MDERGKARLAAKIGARVAALRAELGMTQAELAEKVGIGDEAVSRFERGMAVPTLPRLFDLAKALGSPAANLLLEASDEPDDQAARIARRIAQLSADDGDFLVEWVERMAQQLRRSGDRRSRR